MTQQKLLPEEANIGNILSPATDPGRTDPPVRTTRDGRTRPPDHPGWTDRQRKAYENLICTRKNCQKTKVKKHIVPCILLFFAILTDGPARRTTRDGRTDKEKLIKTLYLPGQTVKKQKIIIFFHVFHYFLLCFAITRA